MQIWVYTAREHPSADDGNFGESELTRLKATMAGSDLQTTGIRLKELGYRIEVDCSAPHFGLYYYENKKESRELREHLDFDANL